FLLAVVAKIVAVGLGIMRTTSVLDLALISILGGLLASVSVLVATLVLAAGSVRYGWDLDNVTAPLVSTLGDVLTIPALWLATFAVRLPVVSSVLGVVVSAAAVLSLFAGWQARRPILRQIVRESAPILFVAVGLSTMAGIAIEKRLEVF